MTPTSDDRREVAAMLLIEVKDEDTSLDYPVHRIINDVLGVNGAWGAKAAHILADLIDPTCTVRGYGHPDEFRVVKGCSACGCGWYEDVFGKPYAYCPHCGARVVSDDDQ